MGSDGHRFNPDLDREPPAQDSKGDIHNLQVNVRKRLQTAHRLAALRNVAHRLVASAFFLDFHTKTTAEKSERICIGAVGCRFEDGSTELSALGKILEDRRTDNFEPYFLVKPNTETMTHSFKIPITMDVIRGMTDSAIFELPGLYIHLRDETKTTSIALFLSAHDGLEPDGFPVSGFPRVILGDISKARPKGPVRVSSEQHLSSPTLRHSKKVSDVDSISLNGPGAVSRRNSSDNSWHDAQTKGSSLATSEALKVSLSDIIAQHQNTNSGSSIKQRTNRFWSYIGSTHNVACNSLSAKFANGYH